MATRAATALRRTTTRRHRPVGAHSDPSLSCRPAPHTGSLCARKGAEPAATGDQAQGASGHRVRPLRAPVGLCHLKLSLVLPRGVHPARFATSTSPPARCPHAHRPRARRHRRHRPFGTAPTSQSRRGAGRPHPRPRLHPLHRPLRHPLHRRRHLRHHLRVQLREKPARISWHRWGTSTCFVPARPTSPSRPAGRPCKTGCTKTRKRSFAPSSRALQPARIGARSAGFLRRAVAPAMWAPAAMRTPTAMEAPTSSPKRLCAMPEATATAVRALL